MAPTPRSPGKFAGIAALLGAFMLFCAAILAMVGVWRNYGEHVRVGWIDAQATVDKCELHEYEPFSREGGGTTYSLRCGLDYRFADREYTFRLNTPSDRSVETANEIIDWVNQHKPGAMLNVKVDPDDPREIAVTSALPIRQFDRSEAAWTGALVFGLPGVLLFVAGRRRLRALGLIGHVQQ